MAMKRSIGRTLAHIDVAANTSVRIHEDFFNTHACYQQVFFTGLLVCSVVKTLCRIEQYCFELSDTVTEWAIRTEKSACVT
jgi:hypothetical protein